MKFLILINVFFSVLLYGNEIIGIWKLSSTVKTRPFTCCGLVGYGVKLKFNRDGTIDKVSTHNKSLTGTKRVYKLNGNILNTYLDNKNNGIIANFFLHNSSSNKNFKLEQVSKSCYKATDVKNINNQFNMCKEIK